MFITPQTFAIGWNMTCDPSKRKHLSLSVPAA